MVLLKICHRILLAGLYVTGDQTALELITVSPCARTVGVSCYALSTIKFFLQLFFLSCIQLKMILMLKWSVWSELLLVNRMTIYSSTGRLGWTQE